MNIYELRLVAKIGVFALVVVVVGLMTGTLILTGR
jgi:hypothetical protein